MEGKERPTPYRDGQNVIKDNSSNAIVYMPPEAKDVPDLIGALVIWINHEVGNLELPAPILQQLLTTNLLLFTLITMEMRLLTNLVLHKTNYGLKGVDSLEEYYARSLPAYYQALTIGGSHNYYLGREGADITDWVMYFCVGMADAFANICVKATEAADKENVDNNTLVRELDQRQKRVLILFVDAKYITTQQVADLLGIHRRTALNLCKRWVVESFIIQHGKSNKSRKYELGVDWLKLL